MPALRERVYMKITKKDQDRFYQLIDEGDEDRAIDYYITEYVRKETEKYQKTIGAALKKVEGAELTKKEMTDISLKITTASNEYKKEVLESFKDFTLKIYSKIIFKQNDITSAKVKATILDNTFQLFADKTEGALSMTNSKVLSTIRKYQKDMMVTNMKIDEMKSVKGVLDSEVIKFRSDMTKKLQDMNPDLYKMLENDQLIVYRDGSLHNFEEYADMSVRTTVLNVDRTAVEIKNLLEGNRVVEFYLRDPRNVKNEREICKEVMSQTFDGLHLVALDPEAAKLLEIPLLEDIKAKGAFMPNCRHSIKTMSATMINRIEKFLGVFETEIA